MKYGKLIHAGQLESNLLTATEVKTAIKDKLRMFYVSINALDGDRANVPSWQELKEALDGFRASVFPEEMPKGKPPPRTSIPTGHHRIPLVDGAQPVWKSLYHLSQVELKEMAKQLDELLKLGYI